MSSSFSILNEKNVLILHAYKSQNNNPKREYYNEDFFHNYFGKHCVYLFTTCQRKIIFLIKEFVAFCG